MQIEQATTAEAKVPNRNREEKENKMKKNKKDLKREGKKLVLKLELTRMYGCTHAHTHTRTQINIISLRQRAQAHVCSQSGSTVPFQAGRRESTRKTDVHFETDARTRSESRE